MNETAVYTTEQGETWDGIAYKVYGDTRHTGWLMQANLPLLDIFVFRAGTVLQIPPVPLESNTAEVPIWREET